MYTIKEDFRVYTKLEFVKANGEVISDEKELGTFHSRGEVMDGVNKYVLDYLVNTLYIKEWNTCDFWIEKKTADGKWAYEFNIDGQIDNDKRNILLNFPMKFTYNTTPELRKIQP